MASPEEKKARRRTIVVYAKAGADGTENLDIESPTPSDAPLSPKEKLMKTKNLMYSDREAELLEDLCRLLISVQPRCDFEKNPRLVAAFVLSLLAWISLVSLPI